MKKHQWTTADEALLREHFAERTAAELAQMLGVSINAVYMRTHALGLRKTREWIAENARQNMEKLEHGGRRHQFKPGTVPWNKGISFTGGGRSGEYRFKPGTRIGRAADLWHPVGTLRLNADGYLERKVNDDRPFYRRWRAEHLCIWEAANGPLPPGFAVIFKDGDKMNIALDNLECISRRELMLRNTAQRYGPEVFALIQLRGALKRQINRRSSGQQPGETP
jgi:hypothetical protein